MKDKIYNTIIIGGGASGLMSGVILGEKLSSKVLIIEKNTRVGKKLSATGNGQGNYTNKNISKENYHGNKEFVSFALANFDNNSLLSFFKKLGGYYVCDERGRYYPSSLQASSLTDLLRFKLDSLNVEVKTETKAIKIFKKNYFEITTEHNDVFFSQNVIIACGGLAAKQYGSDGQAYNFAKNFGHTITDLKPSLVQIKTDMSNIKGLKGIKADCIAVAYSNNQILKIEKGEVLFTDYGLSGNAIFQLSSYIVSETNIKIKLEFLPEINNSELLNILKDKINNNKQLPIEELFTGILNKQLGKAILRYVGIIDLTKKCYEFFNSIENITTAVKVFELKVTGNLGFDYAQVTKGGINTEEIDNKTMMSKIINNLYFTGEIIDIDGDCGGYNLQWAFSSAYLAANNILRGINANIQ